MRSSWNKGVKWNPEIREKIGRKLKGRVPWNKGKKGLMPPNWNKGKHWDDSTKKQISLKLKGRKPWNTGKHLSIDHRNKIAISSKGGENK